MAVDVDVEVAVAEEAVEPLLAKARRNATYAMFLAAFLSVSLVGLIIKLVLSPPTFAVEEEVSTRLSEAWTGTIHVPGPYEYLELDQILLDIRESLNPKHAQVHIALEARVGSNQRLKLYEDEVRAAIVAVVGNRSLDELIGPGALEQIQEELLPRINGILAGGGDPIVRSVLFKQLILEQ